MTFFRFSRPKLDRSSISFLLCGPERLVKSGSAIDDTNRAGGRAIIVCCSLARQVRFELAAFGQPEYALADNVVLNLIGACRDRSAAGCKHPVRPLAAIDRTGRLILELAVGSKQFHREHLDAQIQLRGTKLQNGSLRAGRQAFQLSGELAQAGVLEAVGL